ncbi:tyrosine-type recombinase/integrase [Aerococcus viridans]|uniref:tyrosine-type recombinase/integrase n=1 Tax=Aerococcus viridans TaxID=1377 RepID=UPI002DBE43BB|nr:tyrosine-type recombinase/integrase [Aerococcus viridans]MEC1387352.1 tyrosine-type recombinase/integrase [Aerococcus viridans]
MSKMVNVQPLRSQDEIKEMILAIRRGNKGNPKRKDLAERDVMLFLTGINTGLRVSDLLTLKVGDVKGKNSFIIREGKTKKRRTVNIEAIRQEIDRYTDGRSNEEYLFPSQKGGSAMTTTQAYRVLESAGEWLGRDDIGTHTMRKTFGYHYYKATKDVAMLQDIFNHSAPSITKRYIGITQEEIDNSLKGFRLG